jgi:hypothetical protein
MTLTKLIDRVGDLNPQIFREFKERLTPRNVGMAILVAVAIQGFVLLYFNSQIPVPVYDYSSSLGASARTLVETYSTYCTFQPNSDYRDSLCQLDRVGAFLINWRKLWAHIFICLSWILPLGSILGSVYLLVADLVREEKRGTFNFIRLSPQSALQIFIGKILGVPILVYIAAVAILPLHLFTGLAAGGNISLLVSWYVAIGSLLLLLASAAVLYVLLGGSQAILTVIAVGYPIFLPIISINTITSQTLNSQEFFNSSTQPSWFWIPIISNAILFNVFGTVCFLLASYWIWQALERRYLNPTATVVSKSQSYRANICFQIWIAGFVLPLVTAHYSYTKTTVAWLAGMDFLALLLLIPLLLPNKQAIQDWSRYRRERVTHQHRQLWQQELVHDLVKNDKSPALLAISINIGIAILLWLPVAIVTFRSATNYGVRFLAGVCLASSLILIYAAIVHLGLFLNVQKRKLWIVTIGCGVIILPLVGAYILSPSHTPTGLAAILLLFSPLAPVGILQLSGVSILATFATQLLILTGLTRQLQRKLQISGRSQSKELATNIS